MAIRCSCPAVILPRGQTKKAMPRASMLCHSHIQPSGASASSYKFFTANKVFEDQAMGIVCYTDGKGEVVCEGYDEGPRFSPWSSKDTYHQRPGDHQIPNFRLMKLQIGRDDDFY
ncbi:uncharacterized protein LOC103712576 [Phoenix dactylifera]|uniref:Uncharacterized protein LOC103712576 n=1 Tax=Phoenix dactylifera TaxID=42345 RepID=A0A8B7CEM7_PHODC|nr:uncharacterized protein LOC103712576 [Phoenix dactylifera]